MLAKKHQVRALSWTWFFFFLGNKGYQEVEGWCLRFNVGKHQGNQEMQKEHCKH
jgi:hypothetical protein